MLLYHRPVLFEWRARLCRFASYNCRFVYAAAPCPYVGRLGIRLASISESRWNQGEPGGWNHSSRRCKEI